MAMFAGGAAGGAGGQCTTALYRAVSQSEFADALAFGFRPGPGSYEAGKFFAENPQNALQWGNMMHGPGNFQVLQADFPNSAAAQFMRWERLDGIGPARFGTYDQLGQPVIKPW